MGDGYRKASTLRALLGDRSGNFAIITALTLPMLFGVAGAGLEMTRIVQIRTDLQNTLDSATLGVATEARIEEGRRTNAEYTQAVRDRLKNLSSGAIENAAGEPTEPVIDPVASRSDTAKGTIFTISTSINYPVKLNPLLGFIGLSQVTLTLNSSSQSTFNKAAAMSLYLVLDRSGSMSFKTDTIDKSKPVCRNYTESNWTSTPSSQRPTSPCYVNKMTSLKTAVSYLVETLRKADLSYKAGSSPESELVRTGAIAYDDKTYAAQPLAWGTSAADAYVRAIPQYPEGGTDASVALNTAFAALKTTTAEETRQHTAKKNLSFQRYIVLMTDGKMTGASSDWNATIDAKVRATCAAAKADGIKIFTVAFMAPSDGKSLLQACASSSDNYYAPENMEQIVTAFGDIARKASSVNSHLTN